MENKRCSTCKEYKPLKQFYFKNKKKKIKQSKCIICSNLYTKKHYSENKEAYLTNVKKNNKKYILQNKIFLRELKLSNKCVSCDEDNPDVLDFDHIKPEDKRLEVSYMATHAYSIKTILKEIKKCILVCSNCHRIRTARQQKWYKFK